MTEPNAVTERDIQARLGRTFGPAYEVESEIGHGGMAIVYRARDTRLKRAVAVKVLPPELAFRADIRTRFLREAETAARLSHPNIVPIYAVDEREGLVYFIMALIQGDSVGQRLRRVGAFPVAETRRILREVADALGYAHRNGVVHRDIKPDNILLDTDSGRAIVTDFGIARAASDEGDGTRLTATGTVIGTPAYMSPEQCAGDRTIDGRSDLYALGAVAYHMLTGEPPFTGSSTPAIMVKQVTERPVPPRQRRQEVPADLDAIVLRLLEKEPANRFEDADALIAALDGTVPVALPPAALPAAMADQLDAVGQRLLAKHAVIMNRRELKRTIREAKRAHRRDRDEDKPIPERIRKLRKHLASYAGTTAFLFGINALTSDGFWWFLFPALGMGLGLAKEMGNLWGDGVSFRAMFLDPVARAQVGAGQDPMFQPAGNAGRPDAVAAGTPGLPAVGASDRDSASAVTTIAAALARSPGPVGSPDPTGRHAPILKQAGADRARIAELVSKLSDAERAALPDVITTSDSLYDRIAMLFSTLENLDVELGGRRSSDLDARIAELESSAASRGGVDVDRRLTLLRRQREMVSELEQSRARLLEQYESAALLLQNLALDVMRIRSSGLEAARAGVASATQEARALSREIGYLLQAADELRDLEGKGEGEGQTGQRRAT